jgi:hypothetical protein
MLAQHQRRYYFLVHGRVSDLPTKPSGTASAEVAALDPNWPPPRDQPPGRLGLVRAVDHDARRHQYAAGRLPAGQRSGELGALLADRPDGGVALTLGHDGQLVPDRPPESLSVRAAVRWVLGPLVWRVPATLAARLRSVCRRALDVKRRPGQDRRPALGQPAGWLHGTGGAGRIELWAATHPVLDDILLTTDPDEARELGYRAPVSLGYLEEGAPVTGTPGPAEVAIPWARHWGRRA